MYRACRGQILDFRDPQGFLASSPLAPVCNLLHAARGQGFSCQMYELSFGEIDLHFSPNPADIFPQVSWEPLGNRKA